MISCFWIGLAAVNLSKEYTALLKFYKIQIKCCNNRELAD